MLRGSVQVVGDLVGKDFPVGILRHVPDYPRGRKCHVGERHVRRRAGSWRQNNGFIVRNVINIKDDVLRMQMK